MCCALTCLLKIILCIVNVLLLIMGIVLTILGALLLWGFSYFMKGVYNIDAQINLMLNKFGVTSNSQGVINLMQANAYTIGAIAFSVGIVLIVFAILGIIFVACCDLRCILIIVVIVVIIIALGLIVLIGVFGVNKTDKVYNPLRNYLQTGIVNKYESLNSTNAESIIVNLIQTSLQCCGLYNYTDFSTSVNFNRNAVNSSGTSVQLQFPISCCDFNRDFTINTQVMDNCISYGTSTIKSKGCWTIVQPFLDQYLGYCFTTIGITIGVLFAVIIVGIIAIYCLKEAP